MTETAAFERPTLAALAELAHDQCDVGSRVQDLLQAVILVTMCDEAMPEMRDRNAVFRLASEAAADVKRMTDAFGTIWRASK